MENKINLEKIEVDPLNYLPNSFLNSKRTSLATKTIFQELCVIRDFHNGFNKKELIKKYNFSRKMIYGIIKKWGGKYPPDLDKVYRQDKKSTQSILKDLMICRDYLEGNSIYKTGVIFNLSPKGVQGIIERYGFRLRNSYEAALILHNKKEIKFPLTQYVPSLINKNFKKDFKYLIAVLTITDGCCYPSGKKALDVRRPKLMYYGDKILCQIFADLVYYAFGIIPSVFTKRKDGVHVVIYERKDIKRIIQEILTLSPNYKTSPAHGQKVSEYFLEPRPTIKFLFEQDKSILKEAFRLAMSAEGSCSIYKNVQKGFSLSLSCAHPELVIQWQTIGKKLGLNFNIKKASNGWAGYAGIVTSKKEVLKKFFLIGGFIEGVKVTKQSKRFCGVEKNLLIKKVLLA